MAWCDHVRKKSSKYTIVPSAGQVELKPDHLPTVICLSSPEVDSWWLVLHEHLASSCDMPICLSLKFVPNITYLGRQKYCRNVWWILCHWMFKGPPLWIRQMITDLEARQSCTPHTPIPCSCVFWGSADALCLCESPRYLSSFTTLSHSLSPLSLSLRIRSEGKHHVTSLSVTWS